MMGVVHHHLLTWCFTFKLSLLLITGIEASRNIEESNLDLNDRLSRIEAKDRHQDGEMALLKNALDDERKLLNFQMKNFLELTNRVGILEGSTKNLVRQKRPYRLLPPHMPSRPEERKTDADDESHFRFYGPATGCNDLGRLGYTLNGFYLVQEKENVYKTSSSNNRQIEIVECRFKQNLNAGNQLSDGKETRSGLIPFNNGKPKENFDSKGPDDKEGILKITQTNENVDSKKDADIEKESKATRTKNVDNNLNNKPRFEVKNPCLYRLKSLALNLCLVVKEYKRKKGERNAPNYYLDNVSCDNVPEETYWKIKDKHICSNKEDTCLTVSPNLKDGGLLVNLMAHEESAKSQQWTTRKSNSRTAVFVINVGTSFCLHESKTLPTTVMRCPQEMITEYLFIIEPVNLHDRPKCSLL